MHFQRACDSGCNAIVTVLPTVPKREGPRVLSLWSGWGTGAAVARLRFTLHNPRESLESC